MSNLIYLLLTTVNICTSTAALIIQYVCWILQHINGCLAMPLPLLDLPDIIFNFKINTQFVKSQAQDTLHEWTLPNISYTYKTGWTGDGMFRRDWTCKFITTRSQNSGFSQFIYINIQFNYTKSGINKF